MMRRRHAARLVCAATIVWVVAALTAGCAHSSAVSRSPAQPGPTELVLTEYVTRDAPLRPGMIGVYVKGAHQPGAQQLERLLPGYSVVPYGKAVCAKGSLVSVEVRPPAEGLRQISVTNNPLYEKTKCVSFSWSACHYTLRQEPDRWTILARNCERFSSE